MLVQIRQRVSHSTVIPSFFLPTVVSSIQYLARPEICEDVNFCFDDIEFVSAA